MTWSAKQYSIFEDERTRAARDLLAAIPSSLQVHSAIDIGCGPGNSTQILAARFPNATIRGLDSSPDMIAAARQRLPEAHFAVGDIQKWDEAGPFDVIFANAVLHWLPHHTTLFPWLITKLSPGGHLAIQMPDNLDDPAHHLMRTIAQQGPWANKLVQATTLRMPLESVPAYYDMLHAQCARVDIWSTVYYHPLAGGATGVMEWFKGSGLRPFLEPLSLEEQALYLDRYTQAITQAYPPLADGTVLLPFPRLFIVATR